MPPKKGGGAKGGGDKKEVKKEKGASGGTAVKVSLEPCRAAISRGYEASSRRISELKTVVSFG